MSGIVNFQIFVSEGKPCSREMLILGAIFSLWNHPFYCAVCHPDFKTVFVFKIGPILVVQPIITPPPKMKNGKIVKKLIVIA